MIRLSQILFLICPLASCARAPDAPVAKPLAVAEWQFIDAETMQPIEGAFINFAWRGESTSNGMTTCKHGVLGRTDKNGWFRNVAKDPTWYADGTPAFFVPGYEDFNFKYGIPDKDHITAFIREDANSTYGNYPAFEQRWRDMGYIFQGEAGYTSPLNHMWTKTLPAAGFHDRMRDQKNRRRYFIKYQSYPPLVDQTFQFVGKVCSDEGSTNEVDGATVELSDHLRGYHATKYFCDPAWNSIKYKRFDVSIWIRRATWLLPEGTGFKFFEAALPDYYKSAFEERNLTLAERETLCGIVNQYLGNKEKL